MPLFRRQRDPDVEAARAEAEAALPAGWRLEHVEYERWRTPRGYVDTESFAAVGPGGEARLVVALSEADAYRQLARHLDGSLEPQPAWAVPVPAGGKSKGSMLPDATDDSEVAAARAELEADMPGGWSLHTFSSESYRWSSGSIEIYGAAAEGPAGEASLALATGEAATYRALAEHLRGDLSIEDAWAPTLS